MHESYPIDDIVTHDFRYENLGVNRNVLLNKKEDNVIDVVLFGAVVKVGERVLLTLSANQDTSTAWRVKESNPDTDPRHNAFHCVMSFEGIIQD